MRVEVTRAVDPAWVGKSIIGENTRSLAVVTALREMQLDVLEQLYGPDVAGRVTGTLKMKWAMRDDKGTYDWNPVSAVLGSDLEVICIGTRGEDIEVAEDESSP